MVCTRRWLWASISPAALSLQVMGKSKEFLAKEVKAVARSAFDGLTDPTILILATLIGAGKKKHINSINPIKRK